MSKGTFENVLGMTLLDILTDGEVHKMANTNNALIVGYDIGTEDISCLVIGKHTENGIEIIRSIHGKEAEEIYFKLIGENNER